METTNICPSCQKPVPPGVPLGLCPECLVKSGFNTGTAPNVSGSPAFEPPPVDQLVGLFPQLEIIGLVGKGGMGAVYRARQPSLDRFVALKILRPNLAGDAGFAERFTREARALARLNHPNIVAVYDFGKAGELHYLVMEFIEGPNLREVERAGRITPGQALQIVPQICDALQFAHGEGIVHRDIKPENILLDKKGRVKITDFGIAKIAGSMVEKLGLTGAKDVMGTPHYMAPEQLERPQTVDHRADIYSLGVVFYELLTGELPLGKFAVPSRKAPVDDRLDDVVLRALEKEPERRYQQAGEIKTDVQTITSTPAPLKSQGTGVSPLNAQRSAERPAGTKTRRWVIAGIAAVLGLLLLVPVGALFFYWWLSPDSVTVLPPSIQETTDPSVPALRYQWKQGDAHVYSVKLEADDENFTETVSGNIIYQVKAVKDDVATLSFQSRFTPPSQRMRPGKPFRPPQRQAGAGQFWAWWAFSINPFRERQMDSSGRMVSGSTANSAGQGLEDPDGLVLEPFPALAAKTWETTSESAISQSENGMTIRSSYNQTMLQADVKAVYTVASKSNGIVRLKKVYELKTREKVGTDPRVSVAGEEIIEFDTESGVLRALEFKGVVTHLTLNSSQRTPFTLNCKLLGSQEKDTVLNPYRPKELSTADLTEALNDLESSDNFRRYRAANKLAAAKPTEPRTPVEEKLIALLDGPSQWGASRNEAIKALGVWGTEKAVEPLLKAMEDPDLMVRYSAISALAQLNHPEAIAPLVKHMMGGSSVDVYQTGRALRAFGAPAEAPVAELLQNTNASTRREACMILKDVGTTNSIAALGTAARDSDPLVAMMAKDALKTIETRRGQNAAGPAEDPQKK